MKNPLVSIIIPFKNTENYLQECFDSILKQSYTNFEVIAVDDHSTDTSKDLVHSFVSKDNRIKVFQNPGVGIIEALQFGYATSSGTLITRMDSDDIMLPNRLEIHVKSLLKFGKGYLALGKVRYFAENGINNGYAKYEKWLNALIENGTNYSEIYKECVIPSPCWMVHKSDFELCDAFHPNTYPEDYDLAFRFYKHQLKCIPCADVLHLWRDYSTRTSRTSEHYADNYFLGLKLHYFLKLDYQNNKKLVIWGAGKKGKTIAKLLQEQQIEFYWVCDNPKKIGKHIFGVEMQYYKILKTEENSQIIIAVANDEEQKSMIIFLKSADKMVNKDYFFFC
jgi:glycosyltransferase involved in cell wall biosynthesis